MTRGRLLSAFLVAAGLAGCAPQEFSAEEKATIASLALSALPKLPYDPTNRFADDPAAAALGATLFFDQRLSANGQVSCGTCHVIDRQFQDDRPRAVGIGTTDRRTMPLAGVAWQKWFFWDGRRDSLWSQALVPLENPVEHGGNRVAYARFMAGAFGERYARIFGPLPDMTGWPAHGGPLGDAVQRAAWDAMADRQRADADAVFANIGKAIAAFERSLVPPRTRFDRFAEALAAGRPAMGDAALSEQELYGLRLFIGRAGCVTCHNGPRFSDDHFHNTGVPAVPGLPEDLGRETAVGEVAADPFNCLGRFSDAGADACGELRFMVTSGPELRRAYKTPSLRGAAARPPYMHAGQIATLDDVVAHYVRAPKSPDGQSELAPLAISERERAALAAFLGTLSE